MSAVNEGYVSKVTLTAVILWLVVAGMFAAAWVVAIVWPEHWLYAVLLAATACGFATFTGALHNRIYVERLTRLIRACSQLETGMTSGELRSVRDDSCHSR